MVTPIIFGVGSLILILISRRSLLRPRTHGFFRFFAWEAILGLLAVNLPLWFHEPLTWHQLISWPLLFICILPLVLGVIQLRKGGQANGDARSGEELYRFERTTKLVTDGVFGLIRHPLYSSLLILAWGIFFKEPALLGYLLISAATIALFLAARMDEAECLQVFGGEYREYMRHTRMFIPYVV